MTNDDIANSEQGEDFENKRTKYKIFQSIIYNTFFTNSCLSRNRTPILVLRKNVISNFIFPIRVYKDYTVPSFITTTVTDDGMASGPATLLQKWKNSAKNELPHIS